jgi:Tfp pilus assembly protein PilO
MTVTSVNKILKVSIIACALLTFVGLYVANYKIQDVAEETAGLKSKLELNTKQIKQYEITKKKVESLSDVNDLAQKVLPKEQEQSLTVAEISQFALRSRLKIVDITFKGIDKSQPAKGDVKKKSIIPSGVQVVPLSVQFQEGAEYQYILDFLKYVEDNRRTMQVTNISLTPMDTDRKRFKDVMVDINLYTTEKVPEKKNEKN